MCFKFTLSVISSQTAFIPDDVAVLCILTCHSLVLAHMFLVSLLKRDYFHNIWILGFEKGEVKLSLAFWIGKIGNVSLSFLFILHLQCLGNEKFQLFFSWRCGEEVRYSPSRCGAQERLRSTTLKLENRTLKCSSSPSTTLNLTFVDIHGIEAVGVALTVAILQHSVSIPNSVI